MKKVNWNGVIGWIVVLILFFGVIGYNAYREREKHKDVFTIRALLPLSGHLAIYAGDFKKGLSNFNVSPV